jgi:elongation factor Ts
MISTNDIAKLRQLTGAGIMDCRQALTESKGDFDQAKKWLSKKGLAVAAKKKDRQTEAGLVYSYIHAGSQVGSLILLSCETDFVARTKDFTVLAKEIALQVASMNPKDVKELLGQDYIREPGKKIQTLIDETIGKLGENIRIINFCRLQV